MNGDDLRKLYEQKRNDPRFRALLETISYAEGTPGTSGYNTVFGGSKVNDLSRHPDKVIRSGKYASSAAGKYQFLTPTWSSVQNQLKLPDFGPQSQDIAALHLIRNRFGGGLAEVEKKLGEGNYKDVFAKLSPTWASLPTANGQSYYGQPVKPLDTLQTKYNEYLAKSPAQPDRPSSPTPASAPASTAAVPSLNVNIIADPESLKKLGITTQDQQADPLNPQTYLDKYIGQLMVGLMTPGQYSNPYSVDEEEDQA